MGLFSFSSLGGSLPSSSRPFVFWGRRCLKNASLPFFFLVLPANNSQDGYFFFCFFFFFFACRSAALPLNLTAFFFFVFLVLDTLFTVSTCENFKPVLPY